HQAHLAALEALGVLQQRRQAGRTRALDQRLLDLEQHHDGLLDVALVDQEQVVHVLLDDRLRDAPGRADGDAFGDRAAALRQRCTNVSCCSAASSSAWARASSSVSPCRTTWALKLRVRSTFTCGVNCGITITARSPSRWAW